jgi:hypothetical protein
MVATFSKLFGTGLILGGCLAAAPNAWAHHSYAMFDRTRSITVNGTVRTFDWTNPHVYIWVFVPNGKGGSDLWAIEGGPPSRLDHIGWDRHSLNPGDKVKIELNPLKDGRNGGYLVKAVRANGEELHDHAEDDPRSREKPDAQ